LQESRLEPQEAAHEALRTTLLDNEEVLVEATTYPPGAGVPTHMHRFPSLVYVVEGGTLETTTPDGAVDRYDLRPGEALWSDSANVHSARNVGSTRVRIVETEVKRATLAAHGWGLVPRVLTAVDLDWKTDPVDPRRTVASLVGDLSMPGPYTVRLRAPAGYEIGLHVHPEEDEQLTVLAGAIVWSTGAPGSGAPEFTLGSGGFVLTPAGTPHRIAALEDTVLQMSGIGPRRYVYLDAEAAL
jgi:quercetin dioxygenase-like cupin family protein